MDTNKKRVHYVNQGWVNPDYMPLRVQHNIDLPGLTTNKNKQNVSKSTIENKN